MCIRDSPITSYNLPFTPRGAGITGLPLQKFKLRLTRSGGEAANSNGRQLRSSKHVQSVNGGPAVYTYKGSSLKGYSVP